ncbi:MAG: prenyltransferase [Desulfobacterota bacterium]|jgi:1,4-dihydroxy-2-naphthoate octaprenyltransferase|nr:prenyltransferase [Thermodesulfobacteriota bacterium]
MNTYIQAFRLPFLTGSLVPVLQAGALAYLEGHLQVFPLILVLIGVGALHSAGNLINDYEDTPRSDTINPNPTPFSGGSRVILDGRLTARWVFGAAVLCFTLAAFIGLYLILNGRPYVALIGLLGLIASLFYSVGPIQFMSHGLGEITIFFAFGPLITWGTYYVLTGRLTGPAFLLGFPLGFLITAIIWINEFPDYQADQAVGKRNLVVRWGLAPARRVYLLLMLLPYPFLVFLYGVVGLPVWILLGWLTLPLALKGIAILWREYNQPEKIVPAQALTIQTHMILGLLMVIGLLLQRLLG